jgi:hypothetical protein
VNIIEKTEFYGRDRSVAAVCKQNTVDYIIKRLGCADRLFGLVIRVPGYRSRAPGSIPGPTKLSEK